MKKIRISPRDATRKGLVRYLVKASTEQAQSLCRIEEKVDALHRLAAAEAVLEKKMSQELDDVKREVTESKTVMEGAATLLDQLSTLIRNNAEDPAALRKIASDMDAQQQALAAALLRNTPAGTTEPPPATDI